MPDRRFGNAHSGLRRATAPTTSVTMKPIESFTGDFRYLSNFFPSPIKFRSAFGMFDAASVEHAYQASKAADEQSLRWVLESTSPGKAKRRGGRIPLREDWAAARLATMRDLITLKFADDSVLAARLVATGDAPLVEGNAWGDVFWGVSDGVGENHLGLLLMQRRAELLDRSSRT